MSELTEMQEENLREIALIKDDEINFTEMPEWTPAQWARGVRGPGARMILRARAEAGRPAKEAFWAAVKPIIKTDAFRQWFGGSKAVTEEGTPRVLFHAIPFGCDDFYRSDGPVYTEYGGDFGRGFYLYTNSETALTYGSPVAITSGESSARVIPAYLRAINPLVLCTGRDLKNLWAGAGGNDAWLAKTQEEKTEYIQGLGYDSVLAYQWGQWVVYRPVQIKLAISDNFDLAAILAHGLLEEYRLILPSEAAGRDEPRP
jgi:hypothetical protein